jgi:hypothetical protein
MPARPDAPSRAALKKLRVVVPKKLRVVALK